MPQMYPLPTMVLYIYVTFILLYLLPHIYFMKEVTPIPPSFKHTYKMKLKW
uniref:ATP synthase F0 subunit 8 n=1 Tax=Xenophyes cascus TaxID=984453 RepID=L7NB17_9HEMI|nr:ATP synthase F0 subunit 8 [Xenophyes cascus]